MENIVSKLKTSSYLALFIRVVVSSLFILSSLLKQLYLTEFIESVLAYDIFPPIIVPFFAVFICAMELILGVMLLLSIYKKVVVVSLIALMALFTLFVIWSIINKLGWVCNCFGKIFSQTLDYTSLIRNLVILISLIFLLKEDINEILVFDKLKKKYLVILFIILISAFPYIYRKIIPEDLKIQTGDKLDLSEFDYYLHPNNKLNYSLFIFLSLDDCNDCLTETLFWDEIDKNILQKIKPIVFIHAPNLPSYNAFVKHKKINFPVFFDKSKLIINRLHVSTPTKVLVNRSNVVLDNSKMIGSKKVFKNYIERIKKIIADHS